jgi:D-sedoheptulose 7-phosphate isomerase
MIPVRRRAAQQWPRRTFIKICWSSAQESKLPNGPDPASIFSNGIAEHVEVARRLEDLTSVLEAIAREMVLTLEAGGKILWCGNGGSAGDSQHLAAEMVGRFRRERRGLPSVALTTDTSILTAIANDYGYSCVFSRQVEALGSPPDMLVGISTSGNSANVVAAMEMARSLGLKTVALTGAGGGKMADLAEFNLAVASNDTARIQEVHILAGHILCDWVELAMESTSPSRGIPVEQRTAGVR